MYHEDMLGVEGERADVHVACTDQADVIVDGQGLGMEKARLVQLDLDPGLKELLVVRPLGPRHENLILSFGNDEVDVRAAKHRGLQACSKGSSGIKYGVVILICLRAAWTRATMKR